jgi:hypothetical protein
MDVSAAPSEVAARLASRQPRVDGPVTALLVQGELDSSVIDERSSARASGETQGGESPGSVPRKDCVHGLFRAVTQTGGARHAETVRGLGDNGRFPCRV